MKALARLLFWSVGSVALSSQAAPDGGAGAVQLRFAWPVGLTARISHSNATTFGKKERPLLELAQRYRVKVEEGDDGLLRWAPGPSEAAPEGAQLLVDPPMIVLFDREGAFRGYVAPENSPTRQLMQALPLPEEKMMEVKKQMLAAEDAAARQLWDRSVAPWRGLALAPGKPQKFKVKMGLGPMLERVEVDATDVRSIEVDVPCTSRDKARRCVKLISETTPDVSYQARGRVETMRMKRSVGRIRSETVAEPDTLIPYMTTMRRDDTVGREEGDGGTFFMDFIQLDEYVFTYEGRTRGGLPDLPLNRR